jgi:2-methylcitrate dehydratase
VVVFVTRNGKRDPSVDLRMTRNIGDLKVNEQAAKTFRHSNKKNNFRGFMATSERLQTSQTPLVKQIAEQILAFDSKSIPADVATHAKTLILDSIGCALAAREEQTFERALRTLEAIGGNAECTIIGSSRRMPVTSAVMLNGILIRALDLNDAYVGPGQMGHPSDNIAVALSVGEKQVASGRDVLANVIAGYELYCRIQDIIVGRGPWDHVTASALAAPAIAGRLLKLDADQLANALALSAAHGNTLSAVRSGQLSNAKAMANAFVAYQGTLCSLLAAQGATGPLSIFEGKGGLGKAFLAGADLSLLMEPIRDHFRISDVSIKAYPCIGTAQSMVAAALEARTVVADPLKEITQLEVLMADTPFVRGQVEDEDRRRPTSRETADHSFYYLAAVALLDGELTEAQFEDGRWFEPSVTALMERMTIRTDASLNKYTPESFPSVLQIVTATGESRTVEVFYPKGHPKNRMSSVEVEGKFHGCARGVLSEAQQTKIISLVRDLEKLNSVNELMSDLAVSEA